MTTDLNEQFAALQDAYLQTRSGKDLNRLYEFLIQYLTGFLKRYAAKHGVFLVDLEDKADDCALFFIEQYLSKPDWKVARFTGYYGNSIVKVLHNEGVKVWDGIKRDVANIELSDNSLELFNTDVEQHIQELQKEKEADQCVKEQPESVKFLRHRWYQQEFEF
jgi:hypothetical protein